MKKIYLFKVTQKNSERYVGKAPAKDLVRLAFKPEYKDTQEAQRPLDKKRLKDIADFVMLDDATLSTSIVVGTNNKDKFVPIPCNEAEFGGPAGILYYVEFPETEEEFKEYEGILDLMDGQHRLFSFSDDICKLSEDDPYELTFELYVAPTLKQRRLIFTNTNEKQKAVPPNLIMWFKYNLNMLSGADQMYYGIVSMLNSETRSPLKGRIIMSAEQIKGGLKTKEIIKILNKSTLRPHMNELAGTDIDDEKLFNLIVNYLTGWESAVGTKFVDCDKKYGAFSKISGLRYMLALLPTFIDVASEQRRDLDTALTVKYIDDMFAAAYSIVPSDFFDKTSAYNTDPSNERVFLSESATWNAANEMSKVLRNLYKDGEAYVPF